MVAKFNPEDYLCNDLVLVQDPKDPEVRDGKAAPIYVARTEFIHKLEARLLRGSGTASALHTVIYGSPGVGKTHTLSWIMYQIRNGLKLKDKDVDCFIVIPPSIANEPKQRTFSPLYTEIIKSFGKQFVEGVLDEFWKAVRDDLKLEDRGISQEQKIAAIAAKIKSHDFASVIVQTHGADAGSNLDYLWWNWISGQPSAGEEAALRLSKNTPKKHSQTAIDVFDDFFSIIYPTSCEKKRMLLILIDECEKMKSCLNTDVSFVDGLRVMTDDKDNLAVVFVCNTSSAGDAAGSGRSGGSGSTGQRGGTIELAPLNKETITERIGRQNYLVLDKFTEADASRYIIELLKTKRVDGYAEKFQKLADENDEINEDDIDTFPFSKTDVATILRDMQEKLNPRTVSRQFDDQIGNFKQWINSHPGEQLPIFDLQKLLTQEPAEDPTAIPETDST